MRTFGKPWQAPNALIWYISLIVISPYQSRKFFANYIKLKFRFIWPFFETGDFSFARIKKTIFFLEGAI
jgi:hypothetical protein